MPVPGQGGAGLQKDILGKSEQQHGMTALAGSNPLGPNPTLLLSLAQLASIPSWQPGSVKGLSTGTNTYCCQTDGHQGRSCEREASQLSQIHSCLVGGAEVSSNLCLDVCLLSVHIYLVFCISCLCRRAIKYLLSSCLRMSSNIQETFKGRNSKPRYSKNFQNERCKSHN